MAKYLIATMGPGETSQGYAFAKYLESKNEKVIFALAQEENINFISHKFPYLITKNPQQLINLALKEKPNVIVFCNSKMFNSYSEFREKSPFPKILTVSIDSNWLINDIPTKFSQIKWIHKYFINFPQKVFELGLKENGGYFFIPSYLRKKISVVGLIPSYKKLSEKQKEKIRKKLNILPSEKYIFCYFSGWGSTAQFWVLKKIIRMVKKFIKQKKRIKIIAVGNYPHYSLPKTVENFCILNPKIENANVFYQYLASADLVFQHQGLSTLSQAIAANVPVIANVKIRFKKLFPRLNPEEILPFAKLNLCKMFYKYSPIEEVEKEVKNLLYNYHQIIQMKKSQSKYYSSGEKVMYEEIKNMIINISCNHKKQ